MKYRVSEIWYLLLTAILLLVVLMQFIFAGMAIFVHPLHWSKHMTFIHLFGFNLPILMFLFAWIAKLPRWAYGHLFTVILLIFLMYFSANMAGNIPWVGVLHPIIGTSLLFLSFWMVIKVGFYMKHKGE